MDGFGERLKKLRRNKDVTQSALAEVLGVVASAVGKYERLDHAYPSVEVLIKMADFFNVSIDYLLRGIETVPVVENNINGTMTNSSFMQANNGGVIMNNNALTPEATELLRIYETLSGRERLKLLNFAVDMEEGSKQK